MAKYTVPHGWKRGADLEQLGHGHIISTDRYPESSPWQSGQVVVLKLWLGDGEWPNVPPSPKVDAESIYSISFRNAKDLNTWLDWWYSDGGS